ncbi:MAG: PAS domain S-box protein, partial [Methanosarcinaceae archaeon]|nr:PAS domain S-box protein [Methanosarcinaceae archaeon]
MKINHRINLIHISMLVIMMVLIAGAINFTMKGVFEEEINEGEFTVAVHVAEKLTDPLLNDDFALVQHIIDQEKMQSSLGIKYVFVIDQEGVVVAHTFPQVFPVELATANPVPPEETGSIQILSVDGESINDIGVRIPDFEDTNVHIGFSREPILNVINTLNNEILGIIAFVLLLGLVVSFIVIRTITRPIELMVESTKKIGEGNLDHRIHVKAPDELDELAKSINQMAEDLRKSETKYCTVADSVNDMIYLVDHDLRFLACNRKSLECMGVSKEDIIGRPLVEIIRDPDEKEFYHKNLQKILEKRVPETHEREFDIKGQKRYYTMTMVPVFDSEGNVSAVACVGCDITERKRAEEALKESEERYRKLVELATDSIIVHREGRIIFANPAAVTLIGAKGPEDLIGKSVLDFIPPDNRELVIERLKHVLDTHEPARLIEEKLILMDGSLINAEVTGTFITYEGEPAIQTVVHDITEHKRVEEEILIKQKQLLSIFDSIDEIVYVADPDTYELLYFNEAFRLRFGGNVGDKCYRFLQNETSPCSFCTNKYIFGENLGKTYIWEWQNLVDRHWYRCIDKAIKWPDGRMVRYEMAIDVTDRKRAEEELRNSHQQLFDIIEFLPDATFVIDAEKKVIAWNRAIEEMTGVTKEDILGKGDYTY